MPSVLNLQGILNEFLYYRKVVDKITTDVGSLTKKQIVAALRIRFFSFAYVTTPILSLIPFALSDDKAKGLLCFGVGTVSIVISKLMIQWVLCDTRPIILIRIGGVIAIISSFLMAGILLLGYVGLSSESIINIYILAQLIGGLSFAFIDGPDTLDTKQRMEKLVFISYSDVIPGNCRTAGIAVAGFMGMALLCLMIVISNGETKRPELYVPLFMLNALIQLYFVIFVCKNDEGSLGENPPVNSTVQSPMRGENRDPYHIAKWLLSIACIEGWLQFSQTYFNIAAFKALYEKVGKWPWLIIAIPCLGYVINHAVRIGSNYYERWLKVNTQELTYDTDKKYHIVSFSVLFGSLALFGFHAIVIASLGWCKEMDLVPLQVLILG